MRALTARLCALAALVVALSSCELTVQITTMLDDSGGGTFRLALALDRELRTQLESAEGTASQGLQDVEDLFARLHAAGWTVERTEPAGGLLMAGSRRFEDSAGFDRALSELGSSSSEGSFGDLGPRFDYATARSFLRTSSRFSGTMDLSGGQLDPPVREVLDLLADSVRFEVRAAMPGSVGEVTGGGVTEGEFVVWRPKLGAALTFSARSSALRVGSLLLILIPAIAAVGALLWLALGRRRADEPPGAIVPDDETRAIVPDAEPSAILPDEEAGAREER